MPSQFHKHKWSKKHNHDFQLWTKLPQSWLSQSTQHVPVCQLPMATRQRFKNVTCVGSPRLQGKRSNSWPLSGLQGLYTPKRWFAWSSRQDRPNQVTMAPKRECYDSGVVFVSDPRLHFTWLVGWTAELVQHSGYDGHAHTSKNPVQPLASCCSLWLVADNRKLWTFDSFLWLLSNWQRTQNGSQVPAKISLIKSRILHEVNAADKAMSAITSVSHHFENQ
jgi:hypothetical protein